MFSLDVLIPHPTHTYTKVWPPVRDGFQRIVEVTSSSSPSDEKKRNITIETLSMKPLVLSISGFLSHDECDYIAKKATPSMQYSGVSLKDAGKSTLVLFYDVNSCVPYEVFEI